MALLTMQELHERLGHIGEDCIHRMRTLSSVEGLRPATGQVNCRICGITKSFTTPNRKEAQIDRYKPMDVIFSDYCKWGPVLSRGGHKGFVTFLEGDSRKLWVKFVKNKKGPTVLKKFKTTLKIVE